MNKPTKDPFFCEIKAATRDLVRFVGGLKRAQEITGLATSTLSRWTRTDEADLINLMATIALEKECGIPAVTKVMAGVHGRWLSDADAGQEASPFMDLFSKMVASQSGFTGLVADCVADLMISPNEAELLDRALADHERLTAQFRQTLASCKAGEDVPVVGPKVSRIRGGE